MSLFSWDTEVMVNNRWLDLHVDIVDLVIFPGPSEDERIAHVIMDLHMPEPYKGFRRSIAISIEGVQGQSYETIEEILLAIIRKGIEENES